MRAMKLKYITMNWQVANILTKRLAKANFEAFRDKLESVQKSFLSKKEC